MNKNQSEHERFRDVVENAVVSSSDPGLVRVVHAVAHREVAAAPEAVFDALARRARYEDWCRELQGPAHWLVEREGGVGSRFVAYDKAGGRHLTHFGVVTSYDRPRVFEWRAPFSEWQRADIGTHVELTPTKDGGTRLIETLFFETRAEHLPVLAGFLATGGWDRESFRDFLERRLAGLATLLDGGELTDEECRPLDTTAVVAADWAGRIHEGRWVRVLFADGELDFSGSPLQVFDAFSRFARYTDWTRNIHVGAEWLSVRAGGVGSKFLLWEKPGGRQVMHWAVVTECERGRRFTWRAPFAEWGKVMLGTSMTLEPLPGGGTHAYHVLYADLPEEYLVLFGGFGSLHGFDLEFETLHIHEEARGFERLLAAGAFDSPDATYLFDEDRAPAHTWPLQDGRPWPPAALDLVPDRVITYEDLVDELGRALSAALPSPEFLRRYRDPARTRRYNGLHVAASATDACR
jgi:uncharacterized protein YndB with AHSA1/START domain